MRGLPTNELEEALADHEQNAEDGPKTTPKAPPAKRIKKKPPTQQAAPPADARRTIVIDLSAMVDLMSPDSEFSKNFEKFKCEIEESVRKSSATDRNSTPR